MDKKIGITAGFSPHIPARVLACLRRSHITIILCPDNGLADGGVSMDFPIEAVPPDLRLPNSEFDIVFNKQDWDDVRIVRKGEPDTEA